MRSRPLFPSLPLPLFFLRRGFLVSRGTQEAGEGVYRLYCDFKCPVSRVQGYQTLAVNRGER